MTREDIIAYGRKKYGEVWVSKLAKELNYSTTAMMNLQNGITQKVPRRMELEMKELLRRERFAYMQSHAVDVKY